jgi:hypothetical protein
VRERDPVQKRYGKDHRAGGGPGKLEKDFHLGRPFKGIEEVVSGIRFQVVGSAHNLRPETCNLKLFFLGG